MTAKSTLQQQVEEKYGLIVEKLSTPATLDACLEAGLAKLYQDVFAEAPYFEKFTIDEIKDDFQACLRDRGNILVARDPAKDFAPVAFISAVPLKSKFNLAAAVVPHVDPAKAAYLAEDGVAPAYRCKGLSSNMKKLLMEACSLEGFTQMLIRTSQSSYNQINSINKTGGTVIPGLIQDVDSTRLDGTVTSDKRALYVYDLKEEIPEPQVIANVRIYRQDGKDIAYISRPQNALVFYGDLLERCNETWKIMKTYPGLSEIRYGDFSGYPRSLLNRIGDFLLMNQFNRASLPEEKPVFDGSLYVSAQLKVPFPPSLRS